MNTANIERKLLLSLISIITTIGLSGCFRANISIDIKANGSGIVSIALAMTQQAQSLMSGEGGQNFLQDIEDTLADESGNIPEDIDVKRWRDGDYDWVSATSRFSNLEEINQVMASKEIFNHFSLTRKRGILWNEFILDAELDALMSNMPPMESGIDPSAFMQMDFVVKLPGQIMESNGFADVDDPNLLSWTAQGHNTVSMRARSVTVNWLSIFLLCGGGFVVLLFGIFAFGGFDRILYPKKKVVSLARAASTSQIGNIETVQPQRQIPDYIVVLGVEDLLNQVNSRTLNSRGVIHKKPGEIALVWKDDQDKQKFIHVKDLRDHNINVNGVKYLATRDNAMTGIMNVLKKTP